MQTEGQLLAVNAYQRGEVQVNASRRGKKMLNSRNKIESRIVSGGGKKSPLCDPRSELLLAGSSRKEGEKSGARIINGMEKKKLLYVHR